MREDFVCDVIVVLFWFFFGGDDGFEVGVWDWDVVVWFDEIFCKVRGERVEFDGDVDVGEIEVVLVYVVVGGGDVDGDGGGVDLGVGLVDGNVYFGVGCVGVDGVVVLGEFDLWLLGGGGLGVVLGVVGEDVKVFGDGVIRFYDWDGELVGWVGVVFVVFLDGGVGVFDIDIDVVSEGSKVGLDVDYSREGVFYGLLLVVIKVEMCLVYEMFLFFI